MMTKCIAAAIKGGMPVVLDVKDASPHWYGGGGGAQGGEAGRLWGWMRRMPPHTGATRCTPRDGGGGRGQQIGGVAIALLPGDLRRGPSSSGTS